MSIEENNYYWEEESYSENEETKPVLLAELQKLNIDNETKVLSTMTSLITAMNAGTISKKDFFDIFESEWNKAIYPTTWTP